MGDKVAAEPLQLMRETSGDPRGHMRWQAALFVCALLVTWMTDLLATALFDAYPNLDSWAYLGLGLPATACWLIGFRARSAVDVLLNGVIGGVGSAVYLAATWKAGPEPDGKVPQDSAGLFELVALMAIWLLVMSLGTVTHRLITKSFGER